MTTNTEHTESDLPTLNHHRAVIDHSFWEAGDRLWKTSDDLIAEQRALFVDYVKNVREPKRSYAVAMFDAAVRLRRKFKEAPAE